MAHGLEKADKEYALRKALAAEAFIPPGLSS
jgi:hypothetical protein